SAIAASICCFGPLALALLGLGGGALLLRFAPYRPYFLGLATLFLGAAFWVTYRRRAAQDCEPGSVCASSTARRGQKITLWIAALIVALAAAFPYYARSLF
ncbi:MAG TPA: mercuric transporter MerT family protein, partial [Thermoanaerobaculia bacterium]|nr:mercuric transporter MerT family protein [Thermoanaerobaculia bacterium]